MTTTTLGQKILLILFGIFLSFFALEMALRLGGMTFLYLQDWGNRVEMASDEYRILCLGESTTALGGANSYPSQLQAVLNRRLPQKKFRVINKGRVSKDSGDILEQLEGNLNKYRPALVICMIGVNDRVFLSGQSGIFWRTDRFLERFQVYKLAEFLRMHFVQKFAARGKSPDLLPEEGADIKDSINKILIFYRQLQKLDNRLAEYIERSQPSSSRAAARGQLTKVRIQEYQSLLLAAKYTGVWGDRAKTEKYLLSAISLFPENDMGYVELGRLFMNQKADYPKAIRLFYKALSLNPDSVVAYMELAQCYEDLGLKDKVLEVYKKVLSRPGLKGLQEKRDISIWLMENDHHELAIEVLKEAISKNPADYYLYEHLAQAYDKTGQKMESDFYMNKARSLRKQMEDYLPVTIHNYNEMAEIILGRRLRMIVMQYPLKDLDPLKKIFPPDAPILFVENRENFQKAVHKGQYAEYFADTFGGVFGHCTPQGNRLIAENLADVILSKIVK